MVYDVAQLEHFDTWISLQSVTSTKQIEFALYVLALPQLATFFQGHVIVSVRTMLHLCKSLLRFGKIKCSSAVCYL